MVEKYNLDEKIEKIKEVIETLRFYVQQDGGDMSFVSYENDIVSINIFGACQLRTMASC